MHMGIDQSGQDPRVWTIIDNPGTSRRLGTGGIDILDTSVLDQNHPWSQSCPTVKQTSSSQRLDHSEPLCLALSEVGHTARQEQSLGSLRSFMASAAAISRAAQGGAS